jgi:prolyl 4-hydroxylase
MQNVSDAAQRLLDGGRIADAVALNARGVAAGDAAALFQRAMWSIIGQAIPRDLSAARRLLRDAATRGHAEARLLEITLAANGTGAAPDWAGALALLERAVAAGDAPARGLQQLLGAMTLALDGTPARPSAPEPLTDDGVVARVPGLLTAAECTHVAGSVHDLLAPALVADPRTGRMVPHPIRTSDHAVIGPLREDVVIRALTTRLAAVSNTPPGAGEALTVLRYRPGQQFRLHSDVLPGTRNQRVATVLVYLNDDFTGGETVFPDYDLSIRPRLGDAVIFRNTDAAGRPLAKARHAGQPVVSGTKWLATRWIRARAYDPWRGPEAT